MLVQDAFVISWNFSLAYMFPPLQLLWRVLKKTTHHGIPLILIVLAKAILAYGTDDALGRDKNPSALMP